MYIIDKINQIILNILYFIGTTVGCILHMCYKMITSEEVQSFLLKCCMFLLKMITFMKMKLAAVYKRTPILYKTGKKVARFNDVVKAMVLRYRIEPDSYHWSSVSSIEPFNPDNINEVCKLLEIFKDNNGEYDDYGENPSLALQIPSQQPTTRVYGCLHKTYDAIKDDSPGDSPGDSPDNTYDETSHLVTSRPVSESGTDSKSESFTSVTDSKSATYDSRRHSDDMDEFAKISRVYNLEYDAAQKNKTTDYIDLFSMKMGNYHIYKNLHNKKVDPSNNYIYIIPSTPSTFVSGSLQTTLIKPSNVRFLSVEYSNPYMKGKLYITINKDVYLEGNELFSPTFILRYLEYQSNAFDFNMEYILHIMDNNINQFSLKRNQFIRLGERGYQICDL